MPDKEYKITKKHLLIYQKECERWIKALSLGDFKAYYFTEALDGAYGACYADLEGMVCSLILNKTWPEPVTTEKIKDTARHEVLELLMQPLWHAVLCRELNGSWAGSQRHAVIRRLETFLDRK